jgi:hypothetical protein
MSDTMRAKFICDSVAKKRGDREEAELLAVTDSMGEDSDFAEASPFGQLEITIDAEDAQDWFEPGQKYYLDFTPAD